MPYESGSRAGTSGVATPASGVSGARRYRCPGPLGGGRAGSSPSKRMAGISAFLGVGGAIFFATCPDTGAGAVTRLPETSVFGADAARRTGTSALTGAVRFRTTDDGLGAETAALGFAVALVLANAAGLAIVAFFITFFTAAGRSPMDATVLVAPGWRAVAFSAAAVTVDDAPAFRTGRLALAAGFFADFFAMIFLFFADFIGRVAQETISQLPLSGCDS